MRYLILILSLVSFNHTALGTTAEANEATSELTADDSLPIISKGQKADYRFFIDEDFEELVTEALATDLQTAIRSEEMEYPLDPRLQKWLTFVAPTTSMEVQFAVIENTLAKEEAGRAIVFAVAKTWQQHANFSISEATDEDSANLIFTLKELEQAGSETLGGPQNLGKVFKVHLNSTAKTVRWNMPLLQHMVGYLFGNALGLKSTEAPDQLMTKKNNGVFEPQPEDITRIAALWNNRRTVASPSSRSTTNRQRWVPRWRRGRR